MKSNNLSGENVKFIKGSVDIYPSEYTENQKSLTSRFKKLLGIKPEITVLDTKPIHYIFYNTAVLINGNSKAKKEFNEMLDWVDVKIFVPRMGEQEICNALAEHLSSSTKDKKPYTLLSLKYEVATAENS